MEPYYYSKLTKQQQTVCHAMLQGITELADSFLVPKTEGKELADLFFRLRLDHPEIFWASGFHYKYYQDSPNGRKRSISTILSVKTCVMIS